MTGFLPVEPWTVVRYVRAGVRGEMEETGGHVVWLAPAPVSSTETGQTDNREHTETRVELWGTDPEVDVTGSDRMRGPRDPEGGAPRWRVVGKPERWRGRGLGGVKVVIEEVTG
jgi:hypothetical protein